MTEGDRVKIKVGDRKGDSGVVRGLFRERGCGCKSVIVRLDNGREWAGKETEVVPE